MDRFEQNIRINKQVSAQKAIFHSISLSVITAIIMYLIAEFGILFLPNSFIEVAKSKYAIVTYAVLIITIGIIRYFEIKNYLDINEIIRDIKRSDEFPVISYYKSLNDCKRRIEIDEKKLDFIKIFTPVPFLIYLLGTYIEEKPKVDFIINIYKFSINTNEALIYLGFVLILIYSYNLYKIFGSYRINKRDYYMFQDALFSYSYKEKVKKISSR